MLKKFSLALLAASLISLALSFAAAQDSQSAPPAANSNQGGLPPGMPMHRGGPPDPAQHAQMLAKHLKLSADQQTKVQTIFEAERSQMETLHSDTTLSQQDRRSKMMETRKSTDTQIRAVLDSNQQKQWDEMQAKHEQREGHRGGSDSGDQQAPPPQQ
jgi:protein CpxP